MVQLPLAIKQKFLKQKRSRPDEAYFRIQIRARRLCFIIVFSSKRNEIRFECFACVSLREAKKYRYFSPSFQNQFFASNENDQKGHTFTLCFDSIRCISVRIFWAKKKTRFSFLISRFASKHKKRKFFPSYFPVLFLSEKITFSLPLFFSLLMFWLVLLQFRFGVKFFIYIWTKRKTLFFFSH